MAYLKPQSPLQHKDGDYFYPLTTADQVIMEDGSRLNTKLDNLNGGGGSVDIEGIVYAGDESVDSVIAPLNADTLGGKPESELSVAKAVDSDTLAGQLPTYYARANQVTPRNLLDNSDFRNPVNQRGQTSYSGSIYNIDRWRSFQNDNVVTVDNGCIRQTGTQLLQNLDANVIDKTKTYTLAACKVDGTIRIISGTFANQFSNAYLSCYIDTNIGKPSCVLLESDSYKWAALYEGEYTLETLPAYQPKGYGAELAECQRYYIPLGIGQVWSYLSSATLFEGNGTFDVHISTPVQMRIKPTVRIVGAVRIMPSATDITNIFTKTIISNGVVLTVEAQGVSAGSFGLIQQNEGGYMELSADL